MKFKVLLGALLVLGLPGAARAAEDFAKGCDLYNKHQYAAAKPIFEDTVQKYPANWAGHYYLAHTYLALGQRSAAKNEYQACQNCHPSAEVSQSCQKVIASLGGGPSPAATASPTSSAAPVDPLAGGSAAGVEEKKTLSPREAQIEENKKWVTKSARERCEKLRVEMGEEIARARSTGRWYVNRETGETKLLSPRIERQLKEDYEAEMKRIMDEADRKVKDMK